MPFATIARTIRMPRYLWRQVDEIARAEGMTCAQFVREAVMIRVAYRYGQQSPELAPDAKLDVLLDPARQRAAHMNLGGFAALAALPLSGFAPALLPI